MNEEEPRTKGKSGGGADTTAPVVYNKRIKQKRAKHPAHEYSTLLYLIYDYNQICRGKYKTILLLLLHTPQYFCFLPGLPHNVANLNQKILAGKHV